LLADFTKAKEALDTLEKLIPLTMIPLTMIPLTMIPLTMIPLSRRHSILIGQIASTDSCNLHFSEDSLEKAQLPPVAFPERDIKLSQNFTKEISCAENTFNFENACEGDSGSPIIRYLCFTEY
jgi:hypothetical protein